MSERLDTNRVAVFGGEGNMGRVTVELFRDLGYRAICPDPKDPDSPDASEAIRSSKIVFFSVLPIEEIGKIIDETEAVFEAGHIVLDNASVKRPLVEAYRRLEAVGVSICSTHPLCKHDQPLHGQKALILEVGSNSQKAVEIAERLYRNAGMITIPLSFEDHDRAMTVVQLVPHLVMRSVGRALEKSGVDMRALREIAPANFQLFNLSMWRTLVQDPRISATIIANLLGNDVGRGLAQEIEAAIRDVVISNDEQELTRAFGETYSRLNRDDLGMTMNEITTTVLERLANIQIKSVTIEAREDRPGLLREILLPFEEQGVNLTAIDSHQRRGGVKFVIGIDEKTYSAEVLARIITSLRELGCEAYCLTGN
ncbi:prephenate dehydrogenase/arogenate dehydrogenase family protein [Candidatus Curtissbacteria bacterium]|nr:prephenate dehydrogenase/arogenate dehydrogenase family protein [Candidatus Curtissbacteria bacterium]